MIAKLGDSCNNKTREISKFIDFAVSLIDIVRQVLVLETFRQDLIGLTAHE